MAIIGIDLGTTNSLAAVWKDGKSQLIPNSFGGFLTPSAVSIDEDGSILVGQSAKERLVSHPERSACAFKRFMGTDKKFYLAGREFSPEDLSALVLRHLKEDAEAFLGEPVEEALISVPAYFNDKQRSATKRAGQLAGLRVDRLVNEPSAAALACRMENNGEDSSFLVFDFGGGTLDVSVVDCFDNIVSIVAVCGDNHLGGEDFDHAIADAFCKANKLDFELLEPVHRAILLKQAEQCKMVLTKQDAALMMMTGEGATGTLPLNNQKLIEIAAELFGRMALPIRKVLADSGMTILDIDDIILVGGSCKMPVVRQYLAHLLGKSPSRAGSPDTVVALGVGTYAGMKARQQDIKDLLLTDICPFTLGTGIQNRSDPDHLLMEPIIERNSVLPTSKAKKFFTIHDNQKSVCVDVYQGEGRYCSDNLKLGELNIEVPPAPRGKESVEVRFTYDINGILEVEATSKSTGHTERMVIVGEGSGMDEKAVEKRLKELSALKMHPRDKEENRLVIAQGQRLYQETLGETRENVARALDWFQYVLSTQETHRISRASKQTKEFFDRVEEGLESFDVFRFDPEDE